MRAILVTAVLALISAPALAADCTYLSEGGDRLAFVDDGENTVAITEADGDALQCSWAVTPDGPDAQNIVCEKGIEGGFEWQGDTRDALMFRDQIWHADCTSTGAN